MLKTLSPYNLLRESLDVYTAFVPSQEAGATIGPPIVPLWGSGDVALPVPPDQQLANNAFRVDQLLATLGHPATNPSTFAAAATTMQNVRPTLTLSQITYDVWRSLSTAPAQPRVRETNFGFMLGERHYGEALVDVLRSESRCAWHAPADHSLAPVMH